MIDHYRDLVSASARVGVPVKKIIDLFFYLKNDSLETRLLTQKTGLAKNVLAQIKKELTVYFSPPGPRTALSTLGKDVVNAFDLALLSEEKLFAPLDDNLSNIRDLSLKLASFKPEPERAYDQFLAIPDTVARRVILMEFFGDIRGKRILFLGDDDFTSVITASCRGAREIAVLDIDQRILEGIQKAVQAHSLSIITEKHDLRQTLPKNYRGDFDVIFTDPPYSQGGIALFLSRAIEALDKTNLAGRVYLCYGNSDRAKDRFLMVQEIISQSGMFIRWVFDKFNRYTGAESIGNTSSLYILDSTPMAKSIVHGVYNKSIYTHKLGNHA